MTYLFKQKLRLADMAGTAPRPNKVLIYEPEEYLSALYGHYLTMDSFDVRRAFDLGDVAQLTQIYFPDIVVFSLEGGSGMPAGIAWILNFKQTFPNSFVVTTAFNTGAEELKIIMSAGVSGHINRQLTRPQDLATVLKNILQA